jgi:hypothetical protein
MLFHRLYIYGKSLKANVDTGCNVITIIRTIAEGLQLTMQPTSQNIRGHAGGITRAYGTVNVNLTVDLVTVDVGALW